MRRTPRRIPYSISGVLNKNKQNRGQINKTNKLVSRTIKVIQNRPIECKNGGVFFWKKMLKKRRGNFSIITNKNLKFLKLLANA